MKYRAFILPFIKSYIFNACLALWCFFLLSNVGSSVAASFNEEKVPKTTEDLLAIQDALVESAAKVREATVSISIGEGFGSGVIVSKEGLILTAAHVTTAVDKELTVILNDGTRLNAVSMGLISDTDAAMMRIVDEGVYPYVEINRDDDYKLGHWVFALGHSGGFDQVRGPVLRLGRIVRDEEATLHSDCKVIGGDSGGPLFDMSGQLIAIHSRVNQRVVSNMHIPMREYLSHWAALESNQFLGDGPFAERPVKGSGFLGLATSDTDAGIRVDRVLAEGAADKAGFLLGDLIREIDNEPIGDKSEMVKILDEKATGDKLEVLVTRDDAEISMNVKLGKR